ncbi:cation channel sperm-associated protein 2 [Sarcophilus harrisii]
MELKSRSDTEELPQITVVSRAEAVRSKLIDTFSLIDHLRGLSQAVPRHNLREFLDPSRQRKLMQGDHHQLVRFSVRPTHDRILYGQRQQCRLRVRYNRDMPNSLVTVFILFTLDHWYALLQDAWRVPGLSKTFSSIYVILWLLLGSIIFRNIIVAMMVTNFQAIRSELWEEATHLAVQHKADIFKRQIIKRRHHQRDGKAGSKGSGTIHVIPNTSHQFPNPPVSDMTYPENVTKTTVPKDAPSAQENLLSADSPGLVDWETHVHQNLPGLMEMDQDERVVWPRDSLFRYFELLEKLQYNIEERKQLQDFAVKALINLEDN